MSVADFGGATRDSYEQETWFSIALRRSVIRRGVAYAVVVGAVLITINHGDAILRGDVPLARLLKMGLTVLVPYAVSTLSSVGAIRARDRSPEARLDKRPPLVCPGTLQHSPLDDSLPRQER